MKLIRVQLEEHAWMTGCIHEPSEEMANIQAYPVMLVLPGGAFRICSEREGEPVAAAFYAQGFSAFVLDYTTVTKKKDAVMADPMRNVEQALGLIRENSGVWHTDPEKVAMIGFSGGGHLAAAAATHGPLRPDALILGYPGILHSSLRALECPDIIERVDADTPPTFLFGSREDTITPPRHPLAFAAALEKAGVDFELHLFRTGIHGLSLGTAMTSGGDPAFVNPKFAEWFPLCLGWLRGVFGDFPVKG